MPLWIVYWLPLVAAVLRMVSLRPAVGGPTLTPAWVKVVFASYAVLYALLYIGETYVTGGGEVPIIPESKVPSAPI